MQYRFISEKEKIRVDAYLAEKIRDVSRSYIKKLSEEGCLTINHNVSKCSEKIKIGDEIILDLPEIKKLDVLFENIDLEILFEDDDIIIVNKSRGMVVHPANGNNKGTLVNALLGKYGENLSNINGVIRPGIVHRIDKDTSGILVVARNNFTHEKLSQLFKEHDIKREYIALVEGVVKNDEGTIDAPIGRHKVERKKMSVNTQNGKRAVTHFKVIKRYNKATLMTVTLETGRTHQIRVHLSNIGYPIVGDPVYGKRKGMLPPEGQFLHAGLLGFVHPRTNKYVEFTSPLPQYFVEALYNASKIK